MIQSFRQTGLMEAVRSGSTLSPFHLHLLDAKPYYEDGKNAVFNVWDYYSNFIKYKIF